MVRQIIVTDVPGSWQEAPAEKRSHDSRSYSTRFMLRFEHLPRETLEALSRYVKTLAAEVIRYLVAQATSRNLPKSWHMKAAECWTRQTQQDGPTQDRELA